MKRLFLIPVVTGLILAFYLPAYCDQPASTLKVSLYVDELCTVSTSALAFDEWNPKNKKYDERESKDKKHSDGNTAEGSVDVTCSKGVHYKITLDAGDHLKAGHFRQMMNESGDFMPYKIWKDKHRKKEWGDSDFDNTYPDGTSLCVMGQSGTQSHPVYGTVWPEPRKNGFPSGMYTDEVRVKVYY